MPFEQVLFAAQNIPQEKTKFGYVVHVLPAQYVSEVCDIILQPPEAPYTALKTELQNRACPSKRQRLQQLLHVEDLGDRKPSQLLRHMLKLRGGTVTDAANDEIFVSFSCRNFHSPFARPCGAQRCQLQCGRRHERQHGGSPRSSSTGLSTPVPR